MPRPAPLVAIAVVAALLAVPCVGAAGEFEIQARSYSAQSTWGIKHTLGLDKLWLMGRAVWLEKPTGAGVTVGVIDTGIDPSHPDLEGVLAPGGWKDFVGDAEGRKHAEPYDDHGHGTHVAGIIASRGHFQPNPFSYYWIFGNRGIAPGAQLLVAKAMNSRGLGDDAIVAKAIEWCMDPNGDGDLSDGADVINLSIGIENGAPEKGRPTNAFVGAETKKAVMKAMKAGVVIVVSSGNDGKPTVAEPGAIHGVITVGALDGDGQPADFSNHGKHLDLMAPGILVSTYPLHLDTFDFMQDGYVGMAGTSMAAPVVSATVALMMEADPSLQEKSLTRDLMKKVAVVERVLKSTAVPVSGASANLAGAGQVDAYAAVTSVDRGTSELHWGAIILVSLLTLVVGTLLVRPFLQKKKTNRLLPPDEAGH
ncbi:MAG TPA: S8 family serine peptidase [Candidatus Thermoplasmatota archaeon]|nr:S8 family serine peptidase [Candidatus Thermoplasmatota archaeon]